MWVIRLILARGYVVESRGIVPSLPRRNLSSGLAKGKNGVYSPTDASAPRAPAVGLRRKITLA
jgi:hypothetical protein